jgi:hypothetical protein
MLSETEVQYLVGFLYLHTRRSDIAVKTTAVFGEKVYDEAAKERRDVDVVVATAGDTALIGVEVKDEGRALDVTKVEQICLKLKDMPVLKERFLVSTSGFTSGGRRKAAAHGLGCLRLVHGALPKIATVDLAGFANLTIFERGCPSPKIVLEPDRKDLDDLRDELSEDTPVTLGDGYACVMRDLIQHLINHALFDLNVPGSFPFRREIVIANPTTVHAKSRSFLVSKAIVAGVARAEQRVVEADTTCFLEDESGMPFAAAVVNSLTTGGLLGIMFNDSRRVGAFLLPEHLRTIRPIRYEVS